MKYDAEQHHRRSIRLQGYDYTRSGAYFITLCTQDRECLLGEVEAGEMRLNAIGLTVAACWRNLVNHFANLSIDAFVIMPNHLHGILLLQDSTERIQQQTTEPEESVLLSSQPIGTKPGSIGAIMQNFKSISTRRVNRIRGRSNQSIWQRDYYDHIIRNESALQAIRQYILENPQKWHTDKLHPNDL